MIFFLILCLGTTICDLYDKIVKRIKKKEKRKLTFHHTIYQYVLFFLCSFFFFSMSTNDGQGLAFKTNDVFS